MHRCPRKPFCLDERWDGSRLLEWVWWSCNIFLVNCTYYPNVRVRSREFWQLSHIGDSYKRSIEWILRAVTYLNIVADPVHPFMMTVFSGANSVPQSDNECSMPQCEDLGMAPRIWNSIYCHDPQIRRIWFLSSICRLSWRKVYEQDQSNYVM